MPNFVRRDGTTVFVPSRDRQPRRLTREQATALRHADWLQAFEVGMPDPITGKVRKRSMAEIAAIAGVGRQAVWDGIQAARRRREAIQRAQRQIAAG